jgi:hypothetical protein
VRREYNKRPHRQQASIVARYNLLMKALTHLRR